MASKPFDLTVQQQDLIGLRKTLRAETDGKRLEAALRTDLKAALDPLLPEVRAGALEYHSGGLGHAGDSLGEAIADGVKVGVNLAGRLAGARIYISKKGMPRGFKNAPRDVNRSGGWEHPTRGGLTVRQIGKPGYFDKPIKARLAHFRGVVQAVMDRTAARIAARR